MASLEISFDRKKFRAQCNFVRSLISKAKSNFLTNLVTESSSNPRTLWKTLNSILHRNPSNSSPDTPDTQSLANSFLQFFSDKIERIRSKFSPSDSPDPFLFSIIPPPNLSNFDTTTFSEICNLIFSSQNKQCELDSIPTFLLKLCFDELGPTIINIINFSLSEGIFPSSFKQAIVHPLLKKPSLPDDDLNNFRPISNLNFISKILEKVVASRIQSHLLSNSLSSSFQSAYRMFHSTETTLLGIHNDLILAMDRGEVTSLILLDLSAAFDTVDHSILLHRLHIGLVFMVLLLTGFHLISPHVLKQSPSKFHFIFLKSFLWCTSRFRPWPTSFHSLYNSSWLCHLKELNQVPPLCWWYPTVHFFHSFKLNFFTWNALQYFLWHTLLDELKQIAPQSIQNWILTHWY